MNRKTIALTAFAFGLASVSAITFAASPADTVTARVANFKVMGRSMKAIGEQLRSPAPDIAIIRASADALAGAAPKVTPFFPRGTGPESGVRTHALPVIWAKPAEFGAASAKLVNGANALQAAARSGNLDQVKAAMPAVGGACKGCHDQFKARD